MNKTVFDAYSERGEVSEEGLDIVTEQQKRDKVWKKGMQQAKQYLDKSPQIKEMFEKSQDALKLKTIAELH